MNKKTFEIKKSAQPDNGLYLTISVEFNVLHIRTSQGLHIKSENFENKLIIAVINNLCTQNVINNVIDYIKSLKSMQNDKSNNNSPR